VFFYGCNGQLFTGAMWQQEYLQESLHTWLISFSGYGQDFDFPVRSKRNTKVSKKMSGLRQRKLDVKIGGQNHAELFS
jgi:hypothetical protein